MASLMRQRIHSANTAAAADAAAAGAGRLSVALEPRDCGSSSSQGAFSGPAVGASDVLGVQRGKMQHWLQTPSWDGPEPRSRGV